MLNPKKISNLIRIKLLCRPDEQGIYSAIDPSRSLRMTTRLQQYNASTVY